MFKKSFSKETFIYVSSFIFGILLLYLIIPGSYAKSNDQYIRIVNSTTSTINLCYHWTDDSSDTYTIKDVSTNYDEYNNCMQYQNNVDRYSYFPNNPSIKYVNVSLFSSTDHKLIWTQLNLSRSYHCYSIKGDSTITVTEFSC